MSGQDYAGCGDHKFALNLWVNDLLREYKRIASLNIGPVTEITCPQPDYYFFNLYDPDKNVIEITGKYNEGGTQMTEQNNNHCQSCYMPMDAPEKYGTQADGSKNEDYCCHCWQGGKFTYEQTLQEAVESNIPWWKSDDVARARIMEVFPKLKRWAK